MIENKSSGKSLESQYPSVEPAYEFVKPSYDWMLNRIEAMNTKIQQILTFSATITAALPLFGEAVFKGIDFSSGWFYGILASFVLLAVMGILGERSGAIILIHPSTLYSDLLHLPQWEFRKDMIYWAGENFKANKRMLDRKSLYRDIMVVLLLIEIILMIIWLTTAS